MKFLQQGVPLPAASPLFALQADPLALEKLSGASLLDYNVSMLPFFPFFFFNLVELNFKSAQINRTSFYFLTGVRLRVLYNKILDQFWTGLWT